MNTSKKSINFNLLPPKWGDIQHEINCGINYQHKQDLVALFWNTYVYFKDKTISHVENDNNFPTKEIEQFIFDFREHFPLQDREKGVPYFDDLLIQLSDRYLNKESLLSTRVIKENPFPEIFIKSTDTDFLYFNEYFKYYITGISEEMNPISFVFYRMKEEKIIHSVTFKIFIQWLYDNEYIGVKTFSDLEIKGSFSVLSKCSNSVRESAFIKVFRLD